MTAENNTVTKDILKIGVPSFLEVLFTTFSNIIDSKMVSTMGLTAISAVSARLLWLCWAGTTGQKTRRR